VPFAFMNGQVYAERGPESVMELRTGSEFKRGFLKVLIISCHPRLRKLGLHAAAVALLWGAAEYARNPSPATSRLLEPVPHDRYADDVGRFLAGLPARPGSPLAGLQDNPVWAKHRRELDAAWKTLESERLPAMRAFQKSELAGRVAPASPVFYPFSGPDSLNVTVLFPQNPLYVMVGLEPVGTMPTPQQLEKEDRENYLAETRATLATELDKSFFVTRQMDREFRGQVTDGLCLPILELLVRSGRTILGFRYVRLDDAGQIVDRPPNYHAPGHIGNKGMEVEFRNDEDQSIHKLFYFTVNLSDSRLREDTPFLRFLSSLQGATTFLKATSYMLHMPGFSIIRKEVLSESAAVLQDDSGVPYHFYTSPGWDVELFGEYSRPYGSFGWLEQPDLRSAYKTQKTRPLPFRIGYGSTHIPSNLLLATRKG